MLAVDGGGEETKLPVVRLWRGSTMIGRPDVELPLTLIKTDPGDVMAESAEFERLNKAEGADSSSP